MNLQEEARDDRTVDDSPRRCRRIHWLGVPLQTSVWNMGTTTLSYHGDDDNMTQKCGKCINFIFRSPTSPVSGICKISIRELIFYDQPYCDAEKYQKRSCDNCLFNNAAIRDDGTVLQESSCTYSKDSICEQWHEEYPWMGESL